MIENAEQFVSLVNKELVDIAHGNSKLTNGSIYFERNKVPFIKALDRFAANPTRENMDELAALANQDFGGRFGSFITEKTAELKTSLFKDAPLPKPEPAPKTPFNQELYNHLSTILQATIGKQLDMRQIDRLRDDSNRLAAAIDKHIDERASEKALEICRILNKATAEGFAKQGKEIEELQTRVAVTDARAANARLEANYAAQK